MNERTIKPITVAVGTVFAAALATAALAESDSGLFAVDEIDRGYDRLADSHNEEGNCGEGDAEGSCGEDGEEGSCGEGEKDHGDGEEGDGEEADGEEGSCGEGKCGEGKDEGAEA